MAPTQRCGWAHQPLPTRSPSRCKMKCQALLKSDGSGGSEGSGEGGPPRGGPPGLRRPRPWPPQMRRSLPPPQQQRLPPPQPLLPSRTYQGRAGGQLVREALWLAATPSRRVVRHRLPHRAPPALGTREAPLGRPPAAPAARPPLPIAVARPHWWQQQQPPEEGRQAPNQQDERQGWRPDRRQPVRQRHVRQPPPA